MKILMRAFPLIGILWGFMGAYAQTAKIDLSDERQTIRGFGGINHPIWIADLTEKECNTAFGNGENQLGFTILRIWVSDNKEQWAREITTAKRAVNLGATVFATPWNPPAEMTETVYRNNRNEKRLKYSSYQAYTDHLNSFNDYMYNNGIPLHGISFANEPDYGHDWTWYSVDEVYNYTKNYAGQLRKNGTKVITAESFAYSKNYYDKILNDGNALKNIDIIGTHFYASDANTPNSFFQYPLADQKASNKERWMTEHYTTSDKSTTNQETADLWPLALDVSYEIHRAMVEGNFNAYVWWYIRRHYGPIKDDGKISKRGYCMAQYSKFVRPGYVRVGADSNPTYNVYVSAYKQGDNVVIVAVNRSTVSKTLTFSIPNTKVEEWTPYVTSGSKNVEKGATISAPNESFLITLEPQSTTTFVGKAPNNEEPVVPEVQGPYEGVAQTIPGTIEAERYDTGGEGVSYHDEESENKSGAFRKDGVDIEGNEETGYIVGWTISGEWLNYTVNVEKSARYNWEAIVSSANDNASFKLYMDDEEISQLAEVPNTGDWGAYTKLSGETTELQAGTHTLKIYIEGSWFNLDKINFSEVGTTGYDLIKKEELLSGEVDVYTPLGIRLKSIHVENQNLQQRLKEAGLNKGVYLLRSQDGKVSQIVISD